jgi:hypothetical protein
MEPNLVIDDHDLFSMNCAELYNLLSNRKITTLIFVGAATNMCVSTATGLELDFSSEIQLCFGEELERSILAVVHDNIYSPFLFGA